MALNDVLNISFKSITKERVEATMLVTPDLYQPFGFLHGGATISLLESAASCAAEQHANFEKDRPFGVDVHVRHRKSMTEGTLVGVAELDHQEISEYSGALKQFWKVTAYDEENDVISEGIIETKIVSVEYLEAKNRARAAAKE